MTDEEFVFHEDVREKKRIGRGAFNKKGGSRSKKCTLPSDYLTKKEKEAMNGEVITWSPNAYYTWEEFKAFPHNVQHDYLKAMCEKYQCGVNNVVSGIFGDKVASNWQNFMGRRGWNRSEFGEAVRGSGAAKLKRRIQEDMEYSREQVDKFNKKWGLEQAEDETPVETELMDGEVTYEEYQNSFYTAVMHSEKRYGSDTMLMLNHINNTVAWANRMLRLKNVLSLNEVLNTLHIPTQSMGELVGWHSGDDPDISWCRLEQEGEFGLVFNCHDGILKELEHEEPEPVIEETVEAESEVVPESGNVVTHMEIDMKKFDLEKFCIIRSMFDSDAEFNIHISIEAIE